jgi:hypothetical protein
MTKKLDDYMTAAATMDAPTMAAYRKAVPDNLAKSIAKDHIGRPTSFRSTPGETPGPMRLTDPKPLGPPPGIAICDQMMAVEDRLWRRELAQRLGVKPDAT